MLVRGWTPVSQPLPTSELQAAHVAALQQQQGDRRGALAGTKRTRALGAGGSSSGELLTLEQFEESKRRLRKGAREAVLVEEAPQEGAADDDLVGHDDPAGTAESDDGGPGGGVAEDSEADAEDEAEVNTAPVGLNGGGSAGSDGEALSVD
jgi:hypothetical protein